MGYSSTAKTIIMSLKIHALLEKPRKSEAKIRTVAYFDMIIRNDVTTEGRNDVRTIKWKIIQRMTQKFEFRRGSERHEADKRGVKIDATAS